jgi:hypothetical protein
MAEENDISFGKMFRATMAPPMYDLSDPDMPGTLKGAGREALDGLTIVGAGSDIEAYTRSLLGQGDGADLKKQINAEKAAFAEANPAMATSSFLLGTVPTITVGAPAAVAAKIGSKFLPNLAAITGASAGYGALEGLFRGENPEERVDMAIEEAPRMAAGGAVLGAALLGAIKVSPPIFRFITSIASKVMGR